MGDFFVNLITASFHGGIIIAAILLLRLFLKKAPRKWICLLWLLAAVRLVLPFAPESFFSLQPELDTPTQSQTDTDIGDLPPQQGSDPINPVVPGTTPNTPVTPVIPVVPDTEPDSPVITPNEAPVQTPAPVTPDSATVAAWVWLTGAVVLCLYSAVSYLQLQKRVRSAVIVEEGIWQCPNLDTPFVLGFFRPQIYLTAGMSGEQQEFVLRHERCHIRRLDHWWKALGFAILAIHWFNPLVWVAYVLLCQDLETACDEAVVKDMDLATRKAYSLALLSCSAKRRTIAACPVAFGEISVKRRIKNVLSYKKPKLWITLLAAAAVVFVAVCFLTDPISDDETNPSETQSAETTAPDETTVPDDTTLPDDTTASTTPEETSVPTESSAIIETNTFSFIYDGTNPFDYFFFDYTPDLSACQIGHLYVWDVPGKEIIELCPEAVVTHGYNSDYIYYVKASEPNAIYAVPFLNYTQEILIYTSEFGDVTALYTGPTQFYDEALEFVEGGMRYVWYDLTTSTPHVLMEQYYLEKAFVNDGGSVGHWSDYNEIHFYGKLNEDDTLQEYLYFRDTGEVIVWPYL